MITMCGDYKRHSITGNCYKVTGDWGGVELGGIEEGMGVAKDGSGRKLKLRGGSSESEWSFLPLGLGCLHSSRFRILWPNEVQIVHIVQALKDFRQVEILCSTDLELSRPGMKKVFEALLKDLEVAAFSWWRLLPEDGDIVVNDRVLVARRLQS